MAARTGVPSLQQQEKTRAAIKTTQLVKRLQHFALAEKDEQGADVEIDPSRLKAIEVLLRKSLPDLSAVTLTGDPDNPVSVVGKIERVIVDPNA
jgi:hypothetical protein